MGHLYIFGKSRWWNYLEIFLCCLSLAEFSLMLYGDERCCSHMYRVLWQSIKMSQSLRTLRFLRFSRRLQQLAMMITEALKQMVPIMTALLIVLYISSAILTTSAIRVLNYEVDEH